MIHDDSTLAEASPATLHASLFDEHGRRIPPETSSAVHRHTRRWFICSQPAIDHVQIHARATRHLGTGDGLLVSEFESRAKAILDRLRSHPGTRNITSGVGVPFFLPRTTSGDIGQNLDDIYLKAVKSAFQERYPDHAFVNHHADGLTGKLNIVPGSRHERLLDAMRQQDVVGYYFPCLQEYSVPAAVEQMATLPEQFLLAGGFDTCAAFIGSPDLLLRTDGYPPLLWLAALSAEKQGIGYHFEAYGYNLTFNRRAHLDQAAEYWASGLVVLG